MTVEDSKLGRVSNARNLKELVLSGNQLKAPQIAKVSASPSFLVIIRILLHISVVLGFLFHKFSHLISKFPSFYPPPPQVMHSFKETKHLELLDLRDNLLEDGVMEALAGFLSNPKYA